MKISDQQFPNMGEILQGDLVSKIRDGIWSKYFPHHECNCSYKSKVKHICAYGGECMECFMF